MNAIMLRGPAVFALMLAAALLCRWMAFVPAVIDTDEGLYMLQAREWLRGNWPFVAVWDMHPPGAPALIALAMAVLGESIRTVRVLGAFSVAVTGSALHGLVRVAGGAPALALTAGLAYVVLTPTLTGLATNTEILFAPFVVGALAFATRLAARALDRGAAPRFRDLLPIGLLIGSGLVIKQVVVFEGCFAFALAVLLPWWRGVIAWHRVAAMAAAYAALCASPMLLLGLAYLLMGEFATLWDALALAPLRYGFARLRAGVAAWVIAAEMLTLAAPLLLAVVATLRPPPEHRRLLAFGWTWLAVAGLGVIAPGMFFRHYFLMLLPPLGLLAALGAWQLAAMLRPGREQAAVAVLLALLALDAWRMDAPPRLLDGRGLHEPDPVREVAAALRQAVPPGSPVFMLNYHAVVLVLAEMSVTTRFAFPAQLSGRFFRTLPVDADAELARVLGSAPAAIIIDRGWLHTLRAEAIARVEEAIAANYDLAASIAEQRGPVEIWRRRDLGD
jgi:4-amino-4-deoxy-L-arabinose transferase-like glycosyltransferase